MKRLQTHSGTVLAAVFFAITAVFVAAAPAQAAPPTQAPTITASPSNPNTTHAVAVFAYAKAAGETASVNGFSCRQYRTANPPANPESGWISCAVPGGGDSGTHSFPNLTNQSQTFEVRGYNTDGSGPASTYVWTQNIGTPAQAPVLTDQPDDPMVDFPTRFAFEPGAGENGLVDRYQCRIDEGPWQNCTVGSQRIYDDLENGVEHTFEVRGGNQIGYGPATAYTWTGAVANPEPSIRVGEHAVTRLDGGVPEERVGGNLGFAASSSGVTDLGDQNGDEIDDLAVGTSYGFGTKHGLYVVFGNRTGLGEKNLDTLAPNQGYRMGVLGTAWDSIRGYRSIGDQNDDGVRDILVSTGVDADTFALTTFVVYGGVDPTELPACPDAPAVRCLDLNAITDDQGYTLIVPSEFQMTGNGELATPDIDGDGIDDIAMGDPYSVFEGSSAGSALVVRGGERTGATDVTTLPSAETFRIKGGVEGAQFAQGIKSLGDVNGDGKDDLFLGVTFTDGGGFIVYGRPFGSVLDTSTFGPTEGIRFLASPVGETGAENLGDLNRDGRPDLAFADVGIFGGSDGLASVSVLYGPEQPTSDPLVGGFDLIPGSGYLIEPGDRPAFLGKVMENIGDFNNDGTPDLLTTAWRTPVDGVIDRGGARIVFGRSDLLDEPVRLGQSGETGVALLGQDKNSSEITQSVSSIGDFDADGLTDFALGAGDASPNEVFAGGSVYVVPGKSLINQAKTGNANGIDNDSAVLNAGISTNNRTTDAHFEYGTSTEYGQETPDQELPASNNGDVATAEITGLAKNTAYHYRAVATNALGLTRYGDDRTFTTTNTGGGSNCDTDNTLPGCPGYDYCKSNPGKCSSGGGTNANAKLTLISSPKTIKVKRGKRGSVVAIVVNSGGKSAGGVKVCVKAPKKLVKVKKCQSVGNLASGATKTKTFKVTVKKSARKGKKVALKFTASATGLASKKAKAKIAVR